MSKRVQYAQSLPVLPAAPAAETDRVVFYARGAGLYYRLADSTEVGPLGSGSGAAGISPTLLDAKGDLIVASAADTPARLPSGGDGSVLVARPGSALGLAWEASQATIGSIPAAASSLPVPSAIDMGPTGLGGTFEDIPGLAASVMISATVPINAVTGFGLTLASGNSAAEVSVRVVIDSVPEQIGSSARVVIPRSTDLDSGTARILTDPLPPGTYTARVQWRRVSGTTTPQVTTASLFMQAMQGAQGPKGDKGDPGVTPTDVVTLTTAQTITGTKTFSNAPVVPDAAFVLSKISATGTPSASTYLRGDGAWAAVPQPDLTGYVTLSGTQTVSGLKDFTTAPTINNTAIVVTTDARLSDARTPTAHSHGVTDLTATGTRDATTFLRGDNTWAVVPVDAPTNMVTTDTVQTISAVKTFTAKPVVPDATFTVAKIDATGTRDGTTVLHGDGQWKAPSGGASVGGYTTVQSGGTSQTQRTTLNFTGRLSAVDDTLNLRTNVSVSDPTNMVTTDTTQTGLTGDKTSSGIWTASALIASGLTGATAAYRYVGSTTTGAAPTTGTFAVGDWVMTSTGPYICFTAGTPGSWTRAQRYGQMSNAGSFLGDRPSLNIPAATGMVSLAFADDAANSRTNLTADLTATGTRDSTTVLHGDNVFRTVTVPLSSISATGTRDATTYLRGDGTWAVVSGGGTSITQQTSAPASPTVGTLWLDTDEPAASALAAIEPFTLAHTGNLTVKTGASRVYAEVAYEIVSIRASVGTAPAGASVIVDVNLNGTSIYTTQANRPTIAAGANTALGGAPGSISVAQGQYLTVDVDQVGSTTAGADLTVVIRLRRLS